MLFDGRFWGAMLSPSLMPAVSPVRRVAGLGAAVGLALAVAACDPPEKPMIHNLPTLSADRVKILNADTLVIDGRHVHLSNASAPQTTLHARCWAEALLASHEIAYVRDMVLHATSIDFKPTGKIDSYNRELGLVSLDGHDLGEELYEHGRAARLTDPRFDWCQPFSRQAAGAPPISAVINLGQ